MGAYVSCTCQQCKLSSPAIKKQHKRAGHRKLRQVTRQALRVTELEQVIDEQYWVWDNQHPEIPDRVSTGYKA